MKHILILLALLIGTSASAQEVLSQEFHENGRIKSTYFTDGVVVHFMKYFESGRLHEMGRYVDGKRDGVWKQFAENGTVVARIEFVRGARQGTWEFRDPTNVLQVRLRYEAGQLSTGEQYDPTGEVIAQRTY
ncbi:MAG: hypothetical protein JNM91_03605 [Flavobacteriales bacterium]|nr:hypothetical protein [Flavobacteriales bacterium]